MTEVTTNNTTPAEKGRYILVKANEGQLAFGSPHLFKAAAHDTEGRFDFIVETFAPRTGPPLHYHEEQDDTFYVLEGVLTLQAGEEILDLGPGEFISIPPRMPHTFDNVRNGDEPVRAVNVMTPEGSSTQSRTWLGSRPDPTSQPASPKPPNGMAPSSSAHRCVSRWASTDATRTDARSSNLEQTAMAVRSGQVNADRRVCALRKTNDRATTDISGQTAPLTGASGTCRFIAVWPEDGPPEIAPGACYQGGLRLRSPGEAPRQGDLHPAIPVGPPPAKCSRTGGRRERLHPVGR